MWGATNSALLAAGPEPRRASDTAGIAMHRSNQSSGDDVREYKCAKTLRDRRVQTFDVRQAAAEHDHVGVDHVDDTRERTGKTVFIAFEAQRGVHLTAIRCRHDLFGGRHRAGSRGI